MAYTPLKSSVIQLTLEMRMYNQQLLNVLHYRPIGEPPGNYSDGNEVLEFIASIFNDATNGWIAKRATYVSEELKFYALHAQFVHPVRYVKKTFPPSAAEGTQASPAAPQNVCAVVTWRGDFADRNNIGGMHIPGIAADKMDDGEVDAGIRAGGITSECDFLLAPFDVVGEDVTLQLCLGSKDNPDLAAIVTGYVPQPTVRVMRRRTVGHGK